MADSAWAPGASRHGFEPSLLRAVALPTEHGGWGLLGEPLLLSLVLAPCPAGVAFAVSALGAFLARHPARLVCSDLFRGARYPRTRLAAAVALLYLSVSLAAFGIALAVGRGSLWPVFASAAPAALVFLIQDLRLRGRSVVAELAGALALSAAAPACVLLAGWPLERAFGLWMLVGGRAVASVTEVRARLRRSRGLESGTARVLFVHAANLAVVLAAGGRGALPIAAAIVPALLLVRAFIHLRSHDVVAPRVVGWGELRAGLASVAAWVVAYLLES